MTTDRPDYREVENGREKPVQPVILCGNTCGHAQNAIQRAYDTTRSTT